MSTYDNNAMVSGRGIVSDLPFLQQGVSLRGRYVIESVLGSGGFGVTYKAWDALLSSYVAIKEYFPKSVVNRMPGDASVSVFTSVNADEFNRGIHRFLKEAKDLARFNEIPGIVSVFDFFEENNTAYMVMEYLEGCTLREYLRSNGERIDINTGLYMIDSLITALDAVHKSGIIHRDISPENIFICNDSSVKLLDFGAAKQTMDTYTQTVSIVLKHGYAPPEQYLSRGDFGPWTDIYALGATMYRMFTGVMPQESVERMVDDKLPAPDVINPEIPKYLSDAIMTSMEVKAERRYQSVDVLRRALMGHENIDNASMLRKIVMICAPIIGVAVVVICIVLVVQLNKSEPKRRNITEEVSAVASDTTTEEFTENIADNKKEFYEISLTESYSPFAFLDDAEKRTEYYSESDRNKLSGFLFKINLNDQYFWVYQHIYSVSRIDRSKNVIALFIGDTYDEVDSDIVQIDSRADIIIFSSSAVTAKMDLMQRFFGFEQYIRAGAQKTIEIIRNLDIVDSLEKFVAFENKSKLTNAKKLLKAKNSPVLQMKKNDLLENLKKHSRYKTMFKFEEDHIVISSQKEAAAFIKMLNDDIVRSELTGKEYDSSSKMLLGPVGASQ